MSSVFITFTIDVTSIVIKAVIEEVMLNRPAYFIYLENHLDNRQNPNL